MSRKYQPALSGRVAAAAIALLLSACGGGGGAGTGSLSLSVTDAPVQENVDVCIHFTSITLHHSDGDLIQIPYDSSSYYDASDGCINNIDPRVGDASNNAVAMSALQGVLSAKILDSQEVKAGRYNWIRLDVDESRSYVVDSRGQQKLVCPGCDSPQGGFTLHRGITVRAGDEANFMIDVDLARSLNKGPSGDYTLRPALRLVDPGETGAISGYVADSLLPGVFSDADSGCIVYVYAGHDITPDDYHGADKVLTSARVLYDAASMSYRYVAAYLPAGSSTTPTPYTVSLTCETDDPQVDQSNDPSSLSGDEVIFTDGASDATGQNADVYRNRTAVVDFRPGI
jgi:hypothetical protein